MKKKCVHIQPVKLGRAYYRNVYLKSEEWGALRAKILAMAPNGLCEKCRCQKCTDVHHMDYTVLAIPSFETRNQLIALCRSCHDLIEKAKKFHLLPDRHFREQLMSITQELVASHQKAKSQKITWGDNQRELWDSCTIHGRRLICGLLKRAYPDNISAWNGIKITANQFDKIKRITVKNSLNKQCVKSLKKHLHRKSAKFWKEYRERSSSQKARRGFKFGVRVKYEKHD